MSDASTLHIRSCPTTDDLKRMMLGRLSFVETADIEKHLNLCDSCLSVVATLDVESHLVDVLKEEVPVNHLDDLGASGVPDDLKHLMSRLEELRPATDAGGETAGPVDDFPVLSPPSRSDELGGLAHFRVLNLLGAGGMGVVYRAEDTRLQRSVALKVMRPRTARRADARARFLREARAMASIKHDHVVVVHDVGIAPVAGGGAGTPYLAMELLDGESLQAWMQSQRRPPLSWVVRLGRQIAAALAALHGRDLIHRDVKPANLWLEPPPGWNEEHPENRPPLGQVGRAKLLDFGLAFTKTEALAEAQALGTPAYMAPEQLRGEAIDARCDLFGLGCVLYELCTGEHPFPDRHFSSQFTPPLPARDINPAVPAELAHLIARLLAEDPAYRPDSSRQVVQELTALEKAMSGSGEATVLPYDTQPVPAQANRGAKRRRILPVLLLGGAGGIAALAIVVAAAGWKQHLTPAQNDGTHPTNDTKAEPVSNGEALDRATFPGGPPDDSWCKRVEFFLPREQLRLVLNKLEEVNPGYSQEKFAGWQEPELVLRFSERTDKISNIRPLRALAGLKTIVLTGSDAGLGKLSDLSPLRDMRLYSLRVAGNPELGDLSPLRGMLLFKLDVSDTAIDSLASLSGDPIEELLIAHTAVKDLSPLRTLPKLRFLDCRGCPIESLEPLASTPLKELHIDYEPKRDDAVLKRMTGLISINQIPAREFWRQQKSLP